MKPEELDLLIREGEGLTVEFKERYFTKIDRDIVAFSNTKGGYILLGIDDTGKIVGETLTNKMKAEITDLARNCEPSINIKRILQFNGIVVIEIAEGDEKPYSCSSGYYRRLDAVSQKMTQREIHILFRNTITVPFEERLNKEISFNDISKEKINGFFREAGISVTKIFPQDILAMLNLSKKSLIKNVGVLFFAQKPRNFIPHCQMTLVAFKGKDRTNIYDRKDVYDDLLTQFNDAITFLKRHLNVRSEIKGVTREDTYEIPFEALREAVANAIIHRDYSMRGTSTMVEVHEDKVVVTNPGGLPEGLSPRLLINISIRRNELIADMFARMHKVERIGTGIKRMRDAMKSVGLPYPKIKSSVFFTISLQRPAYSLKEPKGSEKSSEIGSEKSSEKILNEIKVNKYISAKKLADIFGISRRAVEKQIAKLKAERKLKRIGSAKSGYWELVKDRKSEK